jgi:VIT1/CCC1 family predicted Fe2+/Mn2+ transporter
MPREGHRTHRIGWLRAAVLGANDGVVSTASLIVGVASAQANRQAAVLAGLAGLVAGALSMAAGEYVSVSSQADTERAELELERRGLDAKPDDERQELAAIYVRRGLDPSIAETVADQLMTHDALGAHARDELGLTPHFAARPLQAAWASAATFAAGAALPLVTTVFVQPRLLIPAVAGASLICLATLGAVAARVGGASAWTGAARVTFWGVLAMVATAAVGRVFGATLG